MNAAETPQLVAMARVLREGLVPAWSDEDVARAVSQALRDLELPVARRVAALCWSDVETELPGRLLAPGFWWSRAGLKPPTRRDEPAARPNQEQVNVTGAAKVRAAYEDAMRRKHQETES